MTEFYGYERPDGSIGIRNHLLVLAPIDCSYEPAKKIAAHVEGAFSVTQHHGCVDDEAGGTAFVEEIVRKVDGVGEIEIEAVSLI